MTDTLQCCEHLTHINLKCSECLCGSINKDLDNLQYKLDQAEKTINDLFYHTGNGLFDLKNKLSNLDKLCAQNDGYCIALESRIEKLENFIPDVLHDFEKRIVHIEESYQGLSAKLNLVRDQIKNNSISKQSHNCPICEGKGIVWG